MNGPRYGHMSIALSGFVYVFGGNGNQFQGMNEETNPLATCEVFDIQKEGWKQAAEMPIAVSFASVVSPRKNTFYVFGGQTNRQSVDNVQSFDTRTGEWALLKLKMPQKLATLGTALTSKSDIVVLGGEVWDPTQEPPRVDVESMYKLEMEGLKWVKMPHMKMKRHFHIPVLYHNEKIYSLGKDHSEIFKENSNTWTELHVGGDILLEKIEFESCSGCIVS